jgi:putative membrane protein
MHATRTVALVMLVTAAACAKKDASRDSTRADSASTAMGPAATTPATTPATPAADTAQSAALSDPNIVYILDQANAADSARGKLAETKATGADVRSFGKLMVGEHHALRAQGQALAKKLNVTPQAPSGDQSEQQTKQEMDSLTALAKGKAWDKAYVDFEVNYHQAVLQTATKALGAAQNAELKSLIQKAAPVIQHHLDRAKEIQQKLGA